MEPAASKRKGAVMPYKDPDKRAAYMREYKGRGKPENPCKCYLMFIEA